VSFKPAGSDSSYGFRVVIGVDVSGAMSGSPSPTTALLGVDEAFVREVAALPAEAQVQRVVAKLKELNPGFDGKAEHKVENGKVTELRFGGRGVADISPVRALRGLEVLYCSGSSKTEQSDISDLSALAGTRLRVLQIAYSKVRDLSALRGLPLTALSVNSNYELRDVSPLRGLGLKFLGILTTSVDDLSPLDGMELEYLMCNFRRATNLLVLTRMPLKKITCTFKTNSDITILRSIKTLETINDLPVAEFWKRVEAGESPHVK
jgi:Leucine-rich repeat (LRR) protein